MIDFVFCSDHPQTSPMCRNLEAQLICNFYYVHKSNCQVTILKKDCTTKSQYFWNQYCLLLPLLASKCLLSMTAVKNAKKILVRASILSSILFTIVGNKYLHACAGEWTHCHLSLHKLLVFRAKFLL